MNLNTLKIKWLIAAICISFSAATVAQNTKPVSYNWKNNDLKTKAFIENTGQFTGIKEVDGKVLYGINNPCEKILFTNNSINFLYAVPVKEKEGWNPIKKMFQKKEELELEQKTQMKYENVRMTWLGSNPNAEVIAEDELTETYFYFNPNGVQPYKGKLFKKITCKNLYDGIDVVYTFHPETGFKYDIIVHPGANPSLINMSWSENVKLKFNNENLEVKMPNAVITDHAAVSFLDNKNTAPFKTTRVKSGNQVKFMIGAYDKTRTLIIDPWVVSPGFTQLNKGYDIVRNNITGDVYAFGGFPPYEVKKYNNAGVIQWTYVTLPIYLGANSDYYGDIAIDPAGDLYLSSGCCSQTIIKISGGVAPNLIWTTPGYQEPWRLIFDPANNRLIAGGYVLPQGDNICAIDPSNGALLFGGVIIGPVTAAEIRCMFINATGSNIVVLHVSSYQTNSTATNRLTSNTSNFVTNWNSMSGFNLGEDGAFYASSNSPFYNPNMESFHGINGLASKSGRVYAYDGATLNKFNISNGTQLGTVAVPGGQTDECSGIAVDSCGFIYVGTLTEVRMYDSNLVFVSSVPTTTPVYDVILGGPAELIITGDGFVSSIALGACNAFAVLPQSTNILCNGQCTGTATANPAGGTSPYTYMWTPGNQTTQTITGLCAGTYSLMCIDVAGDTAFTQVTITQPAAITLGGSSVQTPCGASQGSATVTPSGGTLPYTYSWSTNSQTGSTATGLSAGNYTVLVTDANGCTQTQTVTVQQGAQPTLGLTGVNLTCNNVCVGTATANASSGTAPYTYIWSNSQTTVTATALCAGTYTCIVVDNFGCDDTATVVVTQPTAMNLNTSVILCTNELSNGAAIVTANGGTPGYNYMWNTTPPQNNDTATAIGVGSYIVYVTDNSGCVDSLQAIVPECPNDSIYYPNVFTPNGDGKNDNFFIYNEGYNQMQVDIYNRWGELLYSYTTVNGFWDGTYKGKRCSDGTYYWVMNAEKYTGEKVLKKGYLHLTTKQ
jgi:gliding motility-associated-like protein